MCWRELDCTTFVQKPTEFEYKDGCFHLNIEIGERASLRLVYPPHTFLQSLVGAEVVMAAFQAEQAGSASNIHELYPVKALSA